MSLPRTLLCIHCVLITFNGISMKNSGMGINDGYRNTMTIHHVKSELSEAKKSIPKSDEFAATRKLNGTPANERQEMLRFEREVAYDIEMVYNVSKRASELCPYSDFCHLNGSELETSVWDDVSCCKSCYCDAGCGERMDCCFDFLDDVKLKQKYNLKCIKPHIERKKLTFLYTQSYYMVTSCLSNASYACGNESAALWGSLYPVYSPESKMIYVNKNCAECNDISDAKPFDVYINCNVSDSVSGTGFTDALRHGRCSVKMRPTDVASVKRFACSNDVISSCNPNPDVDEKGITLKDACAMTKAEVFEFAGGGIKTYANAFCKLCNGIEHSPYKVCGAPDDSIKMISISLTTLIDLRVVSSALDRETPSIQPVDGSGNCRYNEIIHPLKHDCRTISCTNSAIRTSEGCKLYTKTWYRDGYLIHLMLTPTTDDYIPIDTLLRVIHEHEPKVERWLDSKGLSVGSIVISAELEDKLNVSYICGLNMIIGEQSKGPLDPETLLEKVRTSLKKQWRIKVDGKKYYFDVRFDKYLYFVQNGEVRREHILNKLNRSVLQPKLYESIYRDIKPIPPFYITNLFFCEQVTLLSEEWIPGYQGLWLNLTGTGNGTFLGDAEYNLRKTTNGTWQVQICVEDFQSELAKVVTSFAGNITHNMLCLCLLTLCVVIILHVRQL